MQLEGWFVNIEGMTKPKIDHQGFINVNLKDYFKDSYGWDVDYSSPVDEPYFHLVIPYEFLGVGPKNET